MKHAHMSTDFQNEFKLKFDGELNEVDAATLGNSLLNVTAIIEEVNQELKTGSKLDIRVKAHERGSFIVHLALEPARIVDAVAPFITAENIGLLKTAASAIISTVTGLFQLRKVLKNEPPKEVIPQGENVQVITGHGNTLTIDKSTYNIYVGNSKVNEKLSNTFKTLDNDASVEGFEIVDQKEQPLFEVRREEFKLLKAGGGFIKPLKRTLSKQAKLHIKRLTFDKDLIWDFLYAGNKISAYVADDNFYGRIDAGESFAKGDVLDVELEIEQELDSSINAYENKSYKVTKVVEHIPRHKQMLLGFPAEETEQDEDIGIKRKREIASSDEL